MNTTWTQILSCIQENVLEADYSVWIKPLKGEIVVNGQSVHVQITAPNSFVANFVSSRYSRMIAQMCSQIMELSEDNFPKVTIEAAKLVDEKKLKPINMKEYSKSLPTAPAILATSPQQLHLPMPFQPNFVQNKFKHSFNEFVIGASNKLAFAAAESMLSDNSPAEMLFLSSQAGLGKTHLIQSVGNALSVQANSQNTRVAYLSAEQFTSQFVKASQLRQLSDFKDYFRNVDILLLEDVHFLQGKEKTQEELLATIKALHGKGGKVVLTSSFLPKEITGIDSQLISHFHTGFLASIEKPDMETRLHILMDKARKQSFSLPENIAQMMASHITADVRVLEGCLQSLYLRSQLLNRPITEEMALEVIGTVADTHPQMDLATVVRLVCKSFNLTKQELQSASRRSELVLARNTAFYLLRKHTDMTLEQIGTGFKRRHSTVTKGISTLEREMSRESSVGRQISYAIKQIERQCLR